MKNKQFSCSIAWATTALLMMTTAPAVHAAGTASLSSSGSFTESFDSMGASGTAAPLGWSLFQGNTGTSNSTWQTSITANGANSVASMVATSGVLTATSATPSGTNNNGFNAALSVSSTADRVLATSPTSIAGDALQLTLQNNTGGSFLSLLVSYDTVRFTTPASAEELPGYELFFSLDGSSWTNAAALNPIIATVPFNSTGVSTVAPTQIDLGGPVANGGTVYLRWVDDNGAPTSPDQIIGLNNVSIGAVVAPVPEPASLALMFGGMGLLGFIARRRR